MNFIHDDFLLTNQAARVLYHEYGAPQPILDFHCHLSPEVIAQNRPFKNLYEIWLDGDHYKWRAMRSNGVHESYCTGKAKPYEKFHLWAATVPHTLRNPLFHWTHLELKRYFGIDEFLNPCSAPRIWEQANEMLSLPEFSPQNLLRRFRVTTLCTTDDPCDSLVPHQQIANSGIASQVLPTFRPDKALHYSILPKFNAWVRSLAAAANLEIRTLSDLQGALLRRVEYFHQAGCRMSDHGLNHCPTRRAPDRTAAQMLGKLFRGDRLPPEDEQALAGNLLHFLAEVYAKKGWTMQLHLGASRNNNTRVLASLGSDSGFDSIGDWPQGAALRTFLDGLDQADSLPKTILYNLNPADNYLFASIAGCFQNGTIPGKIQHGPSWWFLDQKEGIEWQLNGISNLGLLSRFVGMVTDSRSFMSFPRHEYFRRVLCSLLGREMESGELPNDEKLIGGMVRNICYHNAQQFLQLPDRPNAKKNPVAIQTSARASRTRTSLSLKANGR